MKARIVRAAIRCLDTYGYAETTLSRIQAEAGVSRGAIMHHFADRTEIVVSTAAHLLKQSLRPFENGSGQETPESVRVFLQDIWDNVVSTSGGRAMLEILMACRTDGHLQTALAPKLQEWDRTSLAATSKLFSGTMFEADDVELLWSIVRTFLRGLILHEQYVRSPDYIERMLDRFADLLEPRLSIRQHES